MRTGKTIITGMMIEPIRSAVTPRGALAGERLAGATFEAECSEQAKRAGKIGGQIAGRRRPRQIGMSVNPSDTPMKRPKRDIRAEIARETKLPKRKPRAATTARRASPALAQKVRGGRLFLLPLATT